MTLRTSEDDRQVVPAQHHDPSGSTVAAASESRLYAGDLLGQWRRAWLRAARATSSYTTLRRKTDQIILTRIALKYANPVGGCFVSQGKLAAELGLARGTVNYALKRLLAAGFLVRDLEGCDSAGRRLRGPGTMGGQTTNVYLLSPDLLPVERTITPSDYTAPVGASITPSITPEGTLESSVEQKGPLGPVSQKSAREDAKDEMSGLALSGSPVRETTPSRPEHEHEAPQATSNAARPACTHREPERLTPEERTARWLADPVAQARAARELRLATSGFDANQIPWD